MDKKRQGVAPTSENWLMGTLPAQQFGQIGQGLLDHLPRVGLHVLEFALEKGVIGR